MKYLILISLSILSITSYGQGKDSLLIQKTDTLQVEKVVDPIPTIYSFGQVAKNAQFIGGRDSLNSYIKSNLKYPTFEFNHNIEDIVYISFVIEKDSSLSDIKLVRGSIYLGFNTEALQLMKSMPKWIPAMAMYSDSIIVRQRLTVPIRFRLPSNQPQDKVFYKDKLYHSDNIEYKAQFVGGEYYLNKYIASNLKYPKREHRKKIEDEVHIIVVVEKNGSLSNIKIIKTSKYPAFNEEALRLVKSMPKWIPAMKSDKKIVRQRLEIPIKFRLK